MPENNKTQEFLLKLAPRIERCDFDACVEEAVRVAREIEYMDNIDHLLRICIFTIDF